MTIQKRGSGYVLKAKSTGKVLGKHATKASAERQERAIQASKAERAQRTQKRGK